MSQKKQKIDKTIADNLLKLIRNQQLSHQEIASLCFDDDLTLLHNLIYGKLKSIPIDYLIALRDKLGLDNHDIFCNTKLPSDSINAEFRPGIKSPIIFSYRNEKISQIISFLKKPENYYLLQALNYLFCSETQSTSDINTSKEYIIRLSRIQQNDKIIDNLLSSQTSSDFIRECLPQYIEVQKLLASAREIKRSPSRVVPIYLETLIKILEYRNQGYIFVFNNSFLEKVITDLYSVLDAPLKKSYTEKYIADLKELCSQLSKLMFNSSEESKQDAIGYNEIMNELTNYYNITKNFAKPPSKQKKLS